MIKSKRMTELVDHLFLESVKHYPIVPRQTIELIRETVGGHDGCDPSQLSFAKHER